MNNQEILDRAINALNRNLLVEKAIVDYVGEKAYLTVMGKRFLCVVDQQLTLGDMMEKVKIHSEHDDKGIRILFITVNATPKMLELAKLPNVNVLDCAGNFNIQYQLKNGNTVLMLANKGEKAIVDRTVNAYPVFLEKGLRVIFYFLMNKKNIGRTYREIANATGVAIGTVKNIIDGMKFQRLAQVENHRFIINADRLLMLWSTNYGVNLKPKLQHTRFAFRDNDKRKNWRKITLPEGMFWGGEPAAALMDGYITPGEFMIYTDIPAAALMQTGAVVPDADGDIIVYSKFWKGEDVKTVPAFLIYADLMDTSNSRCIEAAQKIKENELKYLF